MRQDAQPIAGELGSSAGVRHRLLVVDPIHETALRHFREMYDVVVHMQPSPEALRRLICEANVLIMRSGVTIDADILAAATSLKIIARAGSGVDNIDLEAARNRGIAIFNVPDAGTVSVAEFTFGMLICLVRKIALADRQMHRNLWKKTELLGMELSGKTIAVVGYGRIGARVATIAQGFAMHVLAVVERTAPERRIEMERRGVALVDFREALERADVISLHVPLTERTRNLIGTTELQAMKRGAFLVNMARGGVVDEAALHRALTSGEIAGAAIDVFRVERQYSALMELDNVIATPHIGAMTDATQKKIGVQLLENIAAGLAGGSIANRII
jgi:D-3-phosphoglycerate dehydrogenase / 2-oxoglutarate reductase